MIHTLKRWGWPLAKGLLAAAILLAIGRQFYRDLRRPELAELELRPGWLALSAGLYLLGLTISAWFWYHLLHTFGERPRLVTAVRAYFLGHLGKYVPGKAWALLLRGNFVRGPQVRFGVAIIAAVYETLTLMAAGALVAAVGFALAPPDVSGLPWHPLLTGVLLLALCGIPLLPGVFNAVVGRMAGRFQTIEAFRLPRLQLGTLLTGLVTATLGWSALGLAVWAMLQGVMPEPPAWTAATWLHCSASIGLAYVAGFLAIFLPGGIGVREFFLLHLLAFAGSEGLVAAAVLLLRLVWTGAEVLMSAALLGFRAQPNGSKLAGGFAPGTAPETARELPGDRLILPAINS